MWRAENLIAMLTFRGGNPDASQNFWITLPSNVEIARVADSPEASDFSYESTSGEKQVQGAWYAVANFASSEPQRARVFQIANDQLGFKVSEEDDIESCLEVYRNMGTTYYYVSKAPIKLWDMSKKASLEEMRKRLEKCGESADLLKSVFRWNEEHQMITRHSDFHKDVKLCQMLAKCDVFNDECPGWYHPTVLSFSELTTGEIESIHRREIVLVDSTHPSNKLTRTEKKKIGIAGPSRVQFQVSRTEALNSGGHSEVSETRKKLDF